MKWISLPILLSLLAAPAHATLCQQWNQPVVIGSLDPQLIPEASGIAISRQAPGRLYHISDHGNEPVMYATDWKGNVEQAIPLQTVSADSDLEELSYGKCGSTTCLFVADIGDNDRVRTSIAIIFFEEKSNFFRMRPLSRRLKLTYPDGPHNAEAILVHPNGDLFLFTKADSKVGGPSFIFRVPSDIIARGDGELVLQKVGAIDIAAMIPNVKPKLQIATGAAVSPDGQKFMLLTYGALIEIPWDFKSVLVTRPNWRRGINFNVIPLLLPQQEAIGYLPDGKGVIVTSESKKGSPGPIVGLSCAR